jgi:hypothetical protein
MLCRSIEGGWALPILARRSGGRWGEESVDFRALLIAPHVSKALFSGSICILEIGFFAAICPELLENGVIRVFSRPAMRREK